MEVNEDENNFLIVSKKAKALTDRAVRKCILRIRALIEESVFDNGGSFIPSLSDLARIISLIFRVVKAIPLIKDEKYNSECRQHPPRAETFLRDIPPLLKFQSSNASIKTFFHVFCSRFPSDSAVLRIRGTILNTYARKSIEHCSRSIDRYSTRNQWRLKKSSTGKAASMQSIFMLEGREAPRSNANSFSRKMHEEVRLSRVLFEL